MKQGRRWGRIVGLGFLSLVLLLVIAHAIWGYTSRRNLEARMKQIHDAGEPIYLTDFTVAPIPDDDNAMADILAAAESIDEKSEAWRQFNDMSLAPPLTREERLVIGAISVEGKVSLERMDRAMTRGRTVWAYTPVSPVLLQMEPTLNKMRNLANLLAADALLAHEEGDDERAIKRCSQIVLASYGCQQRAALVNYLLAQGMIALAADRVVMMSPTLKIGEGGAKVDQVSQLIRHLSDPNVSDLAIRQAFRGDRMAGIDAIDSMIAPKNAFLRYLSKPYYNNNAHHLILMYGKVDQALTSPDWPSAKPKLPQPSGGSGVLTLLADILAPSLHRAVETHYRIQTDKSLAAVALATRWYAVDHDGKLPVTLEELVPKYIWRVPPDPMASNKPLVYQPAEGAPIVYSVGSNQADDGGSEDSSRAKNLQRNEWEMQDRVTHLSVRPRLPAESDVDVPTTMPATQSVQR